MNLFLTAVISGRFATFPHWLSLFVLVRMLQWGQNVSQSETSAVVFISTFLQFLGKKNTVLGNFRSWGISSNLQIEFIYHHNFCGFFLWKWYGAVITENSSHLQNYKAVHVLISLVLIFVLILPVMSICIYVYKNMNMCMDICR